MSASGQPSLSSMKIAEAEEEALLVGRGGAGTETAETVTANFVVVDAAACSSRMPPPLAPPPVVGWTTTTPPATPTSAGPPPLEVEGRTGHIAGEGQPQAADGRRGLGCAAMMVASAWMVVVCGADLMTLMLAVAGMTVTLMIGEVVTWAVRAGMLGLGTTVDAAVATAAAMSVA